MKPLVLTLNFMGRINSENVKSLQNLIQENPNSIERLIVNINSEGGDVSYGVALYNYLKRMPFPVYTNNLGDVSSAAILLYLAGETRTAEPFSRFMIHPLTIELNGNYVCHQIEEHLEILSNNMQNYASIVRKETNSLNGKADIETVLRCKSLVLDFAHAQEYGIIT